MSVTCYPLSFSEKISFKEKEVASPHLFPILKTERLILRPFIQRDLNWYSKLLSHPEVMYFSPHGPLSLREAKNSLETNIESFRLRDFGLMACFLSNEKKEPLYPIGFCGVLLREMEGIIYSELGYRFFPEAWGHGYATEAAIAVRNDAFYRLHMEQVVSFIDPLNTRSINVAQKIGETFAFNGNYKQLEIAVYRLFRADFLRQEGRL